MINGKVAGERYCRFEVCNVSLAASRDLHFHPASCAADAVFPGGGLEVMEGIMGEGWRWPSELVMGLGNERVGGGARR